MLCITSRSMERNSSLLGMNSKVRVKKKRRTSCILMKLIDTLFSASWKNECSLLMAYWFFRLFFCPTHFSGNETPSKKLYLRCIFNLIKGKQTYLGCLCIFIYAQVKICSKLYWNHPILSLHHSELELFSS